VCIFDDATFTDHASERSRGKSTSRKTENKDLIGRIVVFCDKGISLADFGIQPPSKRTAANLIEKLADKCL
ncbi:MAG: hypothetical protein ABJJ37_02325, partial [Roseibium sp.]